MTGLAAIGSPAFPPLATEHTAITVAAKNMSAAKEAFSTVQALLTSYDRCWDSSSKTYKGIIFDEASFTEVASATLTAFPINYDHQKEFGVIEKKVVDTENKVFVRADLHGDLKSLVENLKSLQEQGLLDEAFRCKPHVHLVFLGDYVDRGYHSLQVLQLLLLLRTENKGQVTLIRGNHEDPDTNIFSCGDDTDFRYFLYKNGFAQNTAHKHLLLQIYQTMPLCLYLGERAPSGEVQYVMFTHGAFELHADPFDLLKPDSTMQTLAVPMIPVGKKPVDLLSDRVEALVPRGYRNYAKELVTVVDKVERKRLKLAWAAWKIEFLALKSRYELKETAYNWGDMQEEGKASQLDSLTHRTWQLSVEDVKHYLRLISSPGSYAVKLLIRGHQHEPKRHKLGAKTVVITMPVGMDAGSFSKEFPGQMDTGYVLTTGPKVKGWTIEEMLRAAGATGMEVKHPVPLSSF